MAGRIVVGIDGTERGAAALRWAVEEAALRDAAVEAVHVWNAVPIATAPDAAVAPLAWTANTDVLDATREAAERIAENQVSEVNDPDGRVTASVVQGETVDALLAAADDADLLVVGTRGRGGLAQALFGSISSRVSDRAHCPVVVVHAEAGSSSD
jgi:nucleotide-binding universal stress UspA family protein